MTYLYDQPSDFAADAVAGFAAAHPTITQVHGGVVRASATPPGQPALVIGGGTGHYPAFSGWVGPGMAHGSPCGNVFASPSASQVYSVARNAENGGGIVLGFGNFAGDVLHFGLAAEKLRADGFDVRVVPVSDDVASSDQENRRDRRGIGGVLPVLKAVGAAIEDGAGLDEAERIAAKANEATRSLGVAFDGCTLPGVDEPLFRVPEGTLAVGMGIHGEPGVRDEPMGTAADVAALLVDGVLREEPARTTGGYDGRAAVILNGLGTVKYEEQFVVYNHVARLLAERDIVPVRPEVGEFVSSLDMAGLSLTLVFLDDELERLWTAPIDTPAFHRGIMPDIDRPLRDNFWELGDEPVPDSEEASRQSARRIADVIALFERVCAREEEELGRIDSVAGDGDHGQGMLLGSSGAADAARKAVSQDAGARTVLARSGEAWAESAGGTSGALWGAALVAAGNAVSDQEGVDLEAVIGALDAAVETIGRLGGAKEGDKTMMDSALPFRRTLAASFTGQNAGEAIASAAAAAREAADATASITANKGRARVLGDKSLGTVDPGALSFAILMTELGEHLA